MPLGPMELVIVLVIVVLLFGAKKLPELARGIGQGVKEFRRETKDEDGAKTTTTETTRTDA